jgi:hypothetical protein
MDRKINVFIGGSSEALNVAKKVSEILIDSGKFNVVIWNKDTFTYNESFLNSLIKASLIYDFGVFVASSDDLALIRKNIDEIPRDNVIFEYGLFLGALGNKKTFLLQEDTCKLPTDLLGYTTPRYKAKFRTKEWTELVGSIADEMNKQFLRSEIQVLPSTSLAIGYFNSFISKVSKYIFEAEGSILNKSKLKHQDVSIEVRIPNELSDDVGAKAFVHYKKESLKIDEIGDPKRPFPVRFYKSDGDDKLTIIDIPTTLNSIRPSINLLLPDTGLGINEDRIKLEHKEVENFKRTLVYLIEQNDYSKKIVTVIWLD